VGLGPLGCHEHVGIFYSLIYFLLILQKYTIISKFSKTNLLPPWPMVLGANTVVHGGRGKLPWATAVAGATVSCRMGRDS
jgi:hypothetical protein